MNLVEYIAQALKSEGVEYLFCYPTNPLIDECARLGIRPIIVRQERTGLHMADAYARMSSGRKLAVFAMQHGPGIENSYGAIAQAYGDSVPVLVIPQGYPQRQIGTKPNYAAATAMRDITKFSEQVQLPAEIGNLMRRGVSALKQGRGGPILIEVPNDLWRVDVSDVAAYAPVPRHAYMPAPEDVGAAVALIAAAKSPVIYAGQGIHYAEAWDALRELAEETGIPVVTSLPGKSAFPEDHPLSLGSGGLSFPRPVRDWLDKADLIIGLGCSFTETLFGVSIPSTPKIIHLTIDPQHLNKDLRCDVGLVGDARLGIEALIAALRAAGHGGVDWRATAAAIAEARAGWLAEWEGHLSANETPISPYRVIRELMAATADIDHVITNDAGRPRDQLTPFWVSRKPLSYIGWGKTTQLGYGLGLAMGAKLACPDKLCINVWGDAAIGFTGMDLETAARERIPVLSILFNNQGMATEINNLPVAIGTYDATRITGNYAEMARSFGAHGERITDPGRIRAAIEDGIEKTREGVPVLLEFMTRQETAMSR